MEGRGQWEGGWVGGGRGRAGQKEILPRGQLDRRA